MQDFGVPETAIYAFNVAMHYSMRIMAQILRERGWLDTHDTEHPTVMDELLLYHIVNSALAEEIIKNKRWSNMCFAHIHMMMHLESGMRDSTYKNILKYYLPELKDYCNYVEQWINSSKKDVVEKANSF